MSDNSIRMLHISYKNQCGKLNSVAVLLQFKNNIQIIHVLNLLALRPNEEIHIVIFKIILTGIYQS